MGNEDLQNELETLPDEVSVALMAWRKASLNREKIEAMLYLKFKAEGLEKTATEIKALVNSDNERYEACLSEGLAESNYQRLYERLMAAKRMAYLRTAY